MKFLCDFLLQQPGPSHLVIDRKRGWRAEQAAPAWEGHRVWALILLRGRGTGRDQSIPAPKPHQGAGTLFPATLQPGCHPPSPGQCPALHWFLLGSLFVVLLGLALPRTCLMLPYNTFSTFLLL